LEAVCKRRIVVAVELDPVWNKVLPSRQKVFADGWSKARWVDPATRKPSDLYWNPQRGKWDEYKTDAYTISTVPGIPPPELPNDFETDKIFKAIEESWAKISKDHPTAVFDPRAKGWRIAKAVAKAPVPTSPLTKEERERRAAEEIAELERQYRAGGLFNQAEYERRRVAIRQKWGLE
jgi:hypothetical protein